MLNNYINYKLNKYYSSKLVPTVANKIKEEAELYFTKPNVMLAVGLDCFAEKSWMQEIENIINNFRESGTQNWLSCFSAASVPSLSKNIPQIVSGAIEVIRKSFWSRLSIVIYQPKRTVTNEQNKSINIQDLFIRIPLKETGFMFGEFRYLRTTLQRKQLIYKYIHSHCPRFSSPEEWKSVCLGTGPIRNTLLSCSQQSEFDEMETKMFFWELDKIIGVESLSGGPYIRMSEVTDGKVRTCSTIVEVKKLPKELKPFVKSYLASGKFKPIFKNNSWNLRTTFLEWLADLTDYWNLWSRMNVAYMTDNNVQNVTGTYYIKDNKLVQPDSRESYINANLESIGNPRVLTFNKKEFKFKVIEDEKQSGPKSVCLILPEIGATILYSLLQTLNYAYDTSNTILSWESLIKGVRPKKSIREMPDFIQ